MPRRKRVFTPSKNRVKSTSKSEEKTEISKEMEIARNRLKGALMEIHKPHEEESDSSSEATPVKTTTTGNRKSSAEQEYLTDEEAKKCMRKAPPAKQPYVLKLFDRSVDLSQFKEETPLYPICRAWVANKPKSVYNTGRNTKELDEEEEDGGQQLPGPEGPPVSRVPDLIDTQRTVSKDNINLNYREAPPPSKEELLRQHAARWAAVKQAWVDQAAKVEARYKGTQEALYKLNVEYANFH